MSFLVDNEVKDRVRSAVDIVDLVGGYLQLRRRAAQFVGLCPFHEDSNPSFTVNPARQTWRCWVCAKGGDVFSFLMEKERVTFGEALHLLADRAGIELPKKSGSNRRNEMTSDQKKVLYDAMAWACREYHECLCSSPDAAAAREYLQERGLTQESIQRYQIGFAPQGWSWLIDKAASKSFTTDVLTSVGLTAKSERGSYYDRFRGRVLFPIRDPQGRPISIGGRVLPGDDSNQAKYVNCSETRLYHKSHELYGLDIARETIQKSRTAVVVEGYTDVIMSNQFGIKNTVAVCGTALGEGHIKLLRRYCDSVVLLLDGDEAGQKRTNEILELFIAAQLDLRVATLPDELDPCDFLLQRGPEAMQAILDRTVDALEHKLRSVCKGFDPLTDTYRANVALEQMLELLSKATRQQLLSDESARVRQDQILMRLSREFGVETPALKARLAALRGEVAKRLKTRNENAAQRTTQNTVQNASRSNASQSNASINDQLNSHSEDDESSSGGYDLTPTISTSPVRYRDMSPMDRELFEIMILAPDSVPFAIERFPSTILGSEPARRLWKLYTDLELAGNALDFDSVMSATEDPQLKNILVCLETEATEKVQFLKVEANDRLHALCERLATQDQAMQDQLRVRELESKKLAADDEMSLLQQVIAQARDKQRIVPPV